MSDTFELLGDLHHDYIQGFTFKTQTLESRSAKSHNDWPEEPNPSLAQARLGRAPEADL